MKIDFIDGGMTIKLDKVPRLLYINEEGYSCGQIYLNGVRIKLLHSVSIKSHTNEADIRPIEYKIKYIEKNEHGYKTIGSENCNNKGLEIEVKLTESKIFIEMINILKSVVINQKIPNDVKIDINEKLNKILGGK